MATRPAVGELAATRARHGPIDWMGGWKLCVWGSLAVVAVAALHWSYISRYAWTVGIDAASPEFAKYFRALLEEIFAAPFHWPFVFYGWLSSAMFAIWTGTIIRLLSIEKAVEVSAAD